MAGAPFRCHRPHQGNRASGDARIGPVSPWVRHTWSFRGRTAGAARPSPAPSCDVRSLSRWNGWKMRMASAGLIRGPVLTTVSWLLLPAIRAARSSPTQALWAV
jgi:hypothetical protein